MVSFAALTPQDGRRFARQHRRTSPRCTVSSPTASPRARPRSWPERCARCSPRPLAGGNQESEHQGHVTEASGGASTAIAADSVHLVAPRLEELHTAIRYVLSSYWLSSCAEDTPENPLTLADGFRAPPSGSATTATTFAVDPDFRVGTAQNWTLSIQQDLPAALQFSLSYLGMGSATCPSGLSPIPIPWEPPAAAPNIPTFRGMSI